jgi:mRNA-degrading endonuclease toxin of MazEF toxin-antitoxin module
MTYVPERGDLAWINFDPQVGREQAKNRPALVLESAEFSAIFWQPVTYAHSRRATAR